MSSSTHLRTAILLLALAAPALAQTPPTPTPPPPAPKGDRGALPLGTPTKGEAKSENPAVYPFTSESAGVLTVVVRATGEGDLGILVTDEDGQPLTDGRSDRDVGGTRGAEQLAVTIPWAGTFHVRVEGTSFEGTPFVIAAGFLALPMLEAPQDKDGRPRGANPLQPGRASTDQVNAAGGDTWDWYAVQVPAAGSLTVVVKAPEGDLVLEAFAEGAFREPLAGGRSDQDMGGVRGNESVTLNVQGNTTIFFRIAATLSEGGVIPYKISCGFIPE